MGRDSTSVAFSRVKSRPTCVGSIALVVNPKNANVKLEIGEVEKAARVLDVPIQVMEATNATEGATWCKNSSLLAANSRFNTVTPVMFASSRCKLVTNPTSTGSMPIKKTIGIVDVAAFAANAAELFGAVAITVTS